MASADRPPLRLRSMDAIDLGYATDFHILLRAIDEAMPEDAILYLEGNATAPDVAAFLREHGADDPRALMDTATDDAVAFHLPLTGGTLADLRLLAEDFASPEVAFHLAVYQDDEILLWAHDAGYGHVLLARSLPEDVIERLQRALGDTIRLPRRYSFFALFRSRDK